MKYALLFILAGLLLPVQAQGRERFLLDFGWKFTNADPGDVGQTLDYPEAEQLGKLRSQDREAEAKLDSERIDPVAANQGGDLSYVQPSFDDSGWKKIDLPHDWAVELPFGDGDAKTGDVYHGGKDIDTRTGTNIGWYRRTFTLARSDAGRALWVEFDGVYRNSLVWFNGHCLGRNNSGYTSFFYNLAPYAQYGGTNTLVVRADATRAEGWFYEPAGIYRHVWLVKTSPVHVAHWGTWVRSIGDQAGVKIKIDTTVRNDSPRTVSGELESTILGTHGRKVAMGSPNAFRLEPGQEKTLSETIPLAKARLWSPDKPYLYRLVSRTKSPAGGSDVYQTPFGVRTIKFDPGQGLFLNGQRVEIKGTANHMDHAGLGAALPDRVQVFRIEKLKEMGSNAYRCAHNPPAPELLDACDRLGMLVLDENRRFGDSPEILGQVQSMILRDRNHPSIFLWGLANEEMNMQQDETNGPEVYQAMSGLAHRLDPTRLTTIANNGEGNSWGKSFSRLNDVMGFNYYHYGKNDPDKYHEAFPDIPCIGTEEGSSLSTRGVYTQRSGLLPAYDRMFPEWGSTAEDWWRYYRARPWIAGAFVWTGFDYRGEPNPCAGNTLAQFGLMDICGFPKDDYYFYKAWWSGQPVVHILPNWNRDGQEGKPIEVWVYSNCDAVELFRDSRSLGRQAVPRGGHLVWQVTYAPGTLLAKGYKAGKIAARDKIETSGPPAAIRLTADRSRIVADGQDVSLVTVSVVDAHGRPVPKAENQVELAVTGGKIIGVGNGDPRSCESDKEPRRKVFRGLAQAIVKAGRRPSRISLCAASPGLTPAVLAIRAVRPVRPRPKA